MLRKILLILGLFLILALINNFGSIMYALNRQGDPQPPDKEKERPEIEWALDAPSAPSRLEEAVSYRESILFASTKDEEDDAFTRAIRQGDAVTVANMLASDKGLVRGKKQRLPPLFEAVQANNTEILRLLLDAGADIDAVYRIDQKEIHTALSYAVRHSKREALFLLLAAGADAARLVCAPRGRCGNVLSVAALEGDAALLREIVERGRLGDRVINMRGVYAQYISALWVEGPRIRLLPALHMAARWGHADAAAALLAMGADLDRKDVYNKRAEYYARYAKAEDVQQIFAIERTNAGDLVAAIQLGETALVRGMLAEGINPDLAAWKGATPLIAAVQVRDVELAKMLLDVGADPNRVRDDLSPLQAAVKGRNLEMVRLLLGAGSDPNEYRDGQMPPFAEAVLSNDRKIVRAFLDAGVSLTTRYKVREGEIHSILSYAISHKKFESALLLARHGADPDWLTCTPDDICGNILTMAAVTGDARLVEDMITEGKFTADTINMTRLVKTGVGLEGVIIRRGGEVIQKPRVAMRLRDGARLPGGGQLLSPLSAAKKAGHKQIVNTLLTHGASEAGPGYVVLVDWWGEPS